MKIQLKGELCTELKSLGLKPGMVITDAMLISSKSMAAYFEHDTTILKTNVLFGPRTTT